MIRKNRLLWVFAIHALALCSGKVWGIGNFNPPASDLMLLPAYCAPRAQAYGNDSSHPQVAPWIGMFGADWIHMHHYCAALLWRKKAGMSFGDKRSRDGMMKMALAEVSYVEKAVTSSFILRAEMETLKGDALAQLNQTYLASLAYRQAIDSKPDYPDAYVGLGALLAKQGDKKAALETVTNGLQHNPKSRALKRAYDEYGGTLPYPAPLVVETPPQKNEAIPAVTAASSVTESAAAVAPDAAGPSSSPEPTIGSPKNPYCRFCTD